MNAWLASFLWVGLCFFATVMIWEDANHWRKLLKVLTTVFIVVGLVSLVYRSFVGPIVALARPEVYYFEVKMFPAKEIKFRDMAHFEETLSKEIITEPRTEYKLYTTNGRVKMNMVIRNVGAADMKNPRVMVTSNVPITAETREANISDDKQVYWEPRLLRRYSPLGDEDFYTQLCCSWRNSCVVYGDSRIG